MFMAIPAIYVYIAGRAYDSVIFFLLHKNNLRIVSLAWNWVVECKNLNMF